MGCAITLGALWVRIDFDSAERRVKQQRVLEGFFESGLSQREITRRMDTCSRNIEQARLQSSGRWCMDAS